MYLRARTSRPRWLPTGRAARAASLLAAAGLAAGTLTACEPAAATFTVTTTADLTDANIGDGVCAPSAGECSLRAAVQEGNTNADPGPIEVVLPAGQFSVGGTAGEDAGALGDLDLTRRFRVVGAGSGLTGSRLTAVALDRIIDVHPGGGFEARDLSMREGVADHGGLIRADGGNVTLTRVNLSVAGATGSGGLIASTDGVVTILDSQLGAAQATIGGGVAAESLVLARSVIAATEAVEGSAIALTSTTAPPSAIDTSVIDATLAFTGSAVFSAGAGVVIRDSQVSDNTAPQGALSGGGGVSGGNSIFVEQTGPDCEAPVTSLGSNLESATSCGFAGPGDLASTSLVQTGFADVSGVTVAHYGRGSRSTPAPAASPPTSREPHDRPTTTATRWPSAIGARSNGPRRSSACW